MLSPTLLDPEWDEYADAWFYRSVRCFLQEDHPRESILPRECRENAELREAVTEALLARRTELVRWIDNKSFVPDCHNGRWVIDWQAVNNAVWDLMPECRARLEADRFTTLDAWLSALHRGEVAVDDLPEHLREPGWRSDASELRRRNWPRPCKSCGQEFRPLDHRHGGPQQRRSNATCPGCRAEARRRTARREARR